MIARCASCCGLILCVSVVSSSIAQPVAVRGTATDSKGKPVPGAQATLVAVGPGFYPRGEPLETVQTDAAGHYAFTSPLKFVAPHGTDLSDRYLVTISDDSHAPGWALITGSDEPGDRDIVLEPAGVQQIQVKSDSDDPVEGASIRIIQAGDTQDRYPSYRQTATFPASVGMGLAKTDASGNVAMHLPRTYQRLVVSADGFADEELFLPGGPQKETQTVRLLQAGSIKGSVKDAQGKPLPGIAVIVRCNLGPDSFRVITDAQGHYECHSLRPANAPQGGSRGVEHYVYLDDPHLCSQLVTVRVSPGESVENVDVTAETGSLVRVKVIDQDTGKPVGGAYIWGGLDQHVVTGCTNEQGVIEFRALGGEGDMQVQSPPGGMGYVGDIPREHFSVSGEDQEITLQIPKIQRLVDLRGRVVDAAGKGLPSIKIMTGSDEEIRIPWSLSGGYILGTVTGLDGSFIVKGFPVGRHLSIYAETRNHHSIGTAEADVTEGLKELNPPITLSNASSADFDLSGAATVDTRNMRVEVAPMVGGCAFMRYARSVNVDSDGHLKIGGILPGLKYRVQQRQEGPAGFQYDGELVPKK